MRECGTHSDDVAPVITTVIDAERVDAYCEVLDQPVDTSIDVEVSFTQTHPPT
jgi:hypothetical protein